MKEALGLLFLRLSSGGLMLYLHGWGKLLEFNNLMQTFPDPLKVGSPLSLALAIFAELFCSVLVIFGLATRLAVIPLIATMFVAFFMIHAEDPIQKKELALVYLIPFITLFFTGAGAFSIDAAVTKKK